MSKSDDLISREAALDCFHDWIDKYGNVCTPDDMPEYRAIEALPSVQPEQNPCAVCQEFDCTGCKFRRT